MRGQVRGEVKSEGENKSEGEGLRGKFRVRVRAKG
jgi:hypothetical protein